MSAFLRWLMIKKMFSLKDKYHAAKLNKPFPAMTGAS